MDYLANFDLLFVAVTITGIGLLGFAIYFTNPKSISNRYFLLFSIITILWGTVNYLKYKFPDPTVTLLLLRLEIFFAVWHAYTLFLLVYSYPSEKISFNKKYKYILFPLVMITSIITLTPVAFQKITNFAPVGQVSTVSKGPGMLIFIVTVLYLIISSFIILIRKNRESTGVEKKQLILMFDGLLATFFLVTTFNFLLPGLYDFLTLSPFGAVFILPFILFTAYAIYKHGLFKVKGFTTIFVAFALTVVTFAEVIFATDLVTILFRSSVFILVFIFSIRLVKNMISLQQANDRQENFLHFLSHEVKSALGKGRDVFSGIIEGDYGTPTPEMKEIVAAADADTMAAVEMVQSILKSADLKNGKVTFKMDSFDFKEAVVKSVSKIERDAKTKGLTFETYIEPNQTFTVMGDSEQLEEHVIRNLVDNAVRYTPKGTITVNLKKRGDKVLFSVKDSGVGITKEDMARLFTEGGRGKDSLKTNVHSTGYGLYFAKGIVDAHGGRIWAESTGAGQGSTFFVEFNTRVAATAPAPRKALGFGV